MLDRDILSDPTHHLILTQITIDGIDISQPLGCSGTHEITDSHAPFSSFHGDMQTHGLLQKKRKKKKE